MGLSSTRTHTCFFSTTQPEMKMLHDALTELCEEWDRRRPHVSEDIRREGDRRLRMLHDAAMLLTDSTEAVKP